MDLKKLTIDEIKGFSPEKLNEVKADIRREIVESKMNILAQRDKSASSNKSLKRNLARVLTVETELRAKANI